ncbi:hypothetical protein PVK06_049609 [Gossypium arboreum]|uniref:Uncharacterized protein n=1 Tax=Gossypium arboreum TaxID=29729 RepID=A0ABR0MJG1_GOSAR|nr:hypothetical protein PVK06_049609 [Gossypium arboreum]
MPPAPPTNLGQGIFASNPGASPADPLVPDLDDPAEVAKLKLDNHDAKYRSLGTEVFSALGAKELSLDLASAFCEQYKHVSDMVPDRMTLQMMEKKPSETFRQYAQRWRDVSAQVEPPLIKTEITVLFINTLNAPFYDKLVGSATKEFANIVISDELIENAVKSGRMEGSKRAAPMKKKEPEAHMVGMGSRYASNPYPNQSRPRNYPPLNFYYSLQNPYYQAPPPSYPVYATNNQRPITSFPQNTIPAQSQPRNEPRPTRPNPERP